MNGMKHVLLLLALWMPSPAHSQEKVLVIVGDSLTEGYGIKKENAYPHLLEAKLKAAGKNWKIINSGVSGSTSASGPGRVDWALKSKPDALMIALGANDGLRGLKPESMEKNLRKAIASAKSAGAKVYLAGMQMPPNYGREYAKTFAATFPKVASAEKVDLIPFLLEGVAGVDKLNLADRIHPNEAGHKVMADLLFNFFKDRL
jgi:acyl-CoA thioesterase-1